MFCILQTEAQYESATVLHIAHLFLCFILENTLFYCFLSLSSCLPHATWTKGVGELPVWVSSTTQSTDKRKQRFYWHFFTQNTSYTKCHDKAYV